MTTMTEQIKGELLNAVDEVVNPDELQAVLKKYSHTKGPLYLALAQATSALSERLTALSQKYKETAGACLASEKQLKERQLKLARLDQAVAGKTRELSNLDNKIGDSRKLLDQVEGLGGLGFSPDELAKLHGMLVKLAASQGAKPEEAISLFFQEVGRYQAIVSLELEVDRAEVAASKAKAEAERWQAEAKAAEAKAKARKASIDITEKLVAQGVKEPDLPQWTRILVKAGVSPEGLAQALEQFASLEKVCQEREQYRKKLEVEARELTAQVKALTGERQQVRAAIGAVRDEALTAMERASGKALEHVEALANKGKEYGELERQAASLRGELALARALTSEDTKMWQQVPRRTVRELLAGLVAWSRSDVSHNPTVALPSFLGSRTFLYSWGGLRLEELLLWALGGLFSEEERRALASGR